MTLAKKRLLVGLIVLLFAGIAVVQHYNDPLQMKIINASNPQGNTDKKNDLIVQLPGQFVVATFAGFREAIAGALWIRADDFWHRGNFEAIIPIVRLVTWLDPHNIDIFITGAWHMDYNFVDRNQLSDKRYIPAAIALLKEGIANNPENYELYFELGWTHYNRKLLDYETGTKYIEEACKHEDRDRNTGKVIPRPNFIDRMLAHQYEKVGRFDDALAQWDRKIKMAILKLIL